MDPERTLNLMQTQFHAKQYTEALESLLNYYDWRVKGGFEPRKGDQIARDYAPKLIDAVENLESLVPCGSIFEGTDHL